MTSFSWFSYFSSTNLEILAFWPGGDANCPLFTDWRWHQHSDDICPLVSACNKPVMIFMNTAISHHLTHWFLLRFRHLKAPMVISFASAIPMGGDGVGPFVGLRLDQLAAFNGLGVRWRQGGKPPCFLMASWWLMPKWLVGRGIQGISMDLKRWGRFFHECDCKHGSIQSPL